MIPLHEPYLSSHAWTFLKECLESGWVSSAGPWVNRFESALQALTQSPYVVAVNSGTAGLHLALQVVGVHPGEGVIIPDITFVATANAIQYVGAQPLLAEVDPVTFLLNIDVLADYLASQTEMREGKCWDRKNQLFIKALVAVHVMGNVCDMDALRNLCERYKICLVEDAAEALGSSYRGKPAGTMGDIGVLSFNGNKILTTGGGGAILTNNSDWAAQVRHLATQAKSDPWMYDHDEVGYNYRMNSLSAALGLSQLEVWEEILEKKKRIFQRYQQELGTVCTLQTGLSEVKTNHWLVTGTLLHTTFEVIRRLNQEGIQVRPIWKPMHKLHMYTACPVIGNLHSSVWLHKHSLSLPSSAGLTSQDQARVISAILATQK
ncbi:MAG: LegC family aminotransferase [Bacteroidota bacterium]